MPKISFSSKERQTYVAGVGVVVGMVIVFRIISNWRKRKGLKTVPFSNNSSTTEDAINSPKEPSQNERFLIIEGIKIKYTGDALAVETIREINDAVLKFAADEFYTITMHDRERKID